MCNTHKRNTIKRQGEAYRQKVIHQNSGEVRNRARLRKQRNRLGKTEKSTSEYSKHQIVNDMGIRAPEHQKAIKAELASQLSIYSLERNGKKKAYANINRLGHEDCSRYEMTHSGPSLPLLPLLPYFYRPHGLATSFSICKLNWGGILYNPWPPFPTIMHDRKTRLVYHAPALLQSPWTP